jgi:cysteine synthase A
MRRLGLEREIVDNDVYERTVERFKQRRIALPTFAELSDPESIPPSIRMALRSAGPDEAHPLNLFRVHWHNDAARTGVVGVPEHVELGRELTGVDARIVVLLADRFPMIGAHKVLASYGCLAPRIITGQFDPTRQRAIWPSTGNYCRGGVAISRLMDCRGVAVLPEGMSRERFEWLDRWVVDASDVIRTPGTESNVKEIYDECDRLSADPDNVIFNQFSEFGNYLVHYKATGAAVERVVATLALGERPRLRAFVSATGSAGTIAAGDYLKQQFGAKIAAVEALECPTMSLNGFGEHNIQGIGDKHIPLIHNVMNSDFVVAVSDRATDRLNVLFNTEAGRTYLASRRHVPEDTLAQLGSLGLSSICNVLAAIKLAKHQNYGSDDIVATVATDGAPMYTSERDLCIAKSFSGAFDDVSAAEVNGEHLQGAAPDNVQELTRSDRERIFNLGYFTWVEQQGVTAEEFRSRQHASFWDSIRSVGADWDALIAEFNGRTGVRESL